MLTYQQALATCIDAVDRVLETETVSLLNAPGRILAHDIMASLAVQPFDNAAMDGYAVYREDIAAATAVNVVHLPCSQVIAAGDTASIPALQRGTCARIMTGAPMPSGADAVVQIERTTALSNNMVTFTAPCAPNENVRYAGEDFKPGDNVLDRGRIIAVHHIMPLATLGIGKLPVVKRPRAAVITTGNELATSLDVPLPSGMIYNSNHFYIRGALAAMGVDVAAAHMVSDDPTALRSLLLQSMQQNIDLVISSGAVSAGDFDIVRPVLEELGAKILFHKIKVKPGKPNLFAKLPNGCLYFGLPGNPVATAAGLRFLVQQTVRRMCGIDCEKPLYARAMNRFVKPPGLHMFLKGSVEAWEDGSLTVDILEGQESFKVSPFLQMNAWVSVAEDIQEIRAGQVLPVFFMADCTAAALP